MNRSEKLLTLVIVILIVIASLEAFILYISNNREEQIIPVRVACVGDSITRGTEYTIYLWQLLGSKYIIGDFGVGGVTVSFSSGNAYINSTAIELAKQFEPDIVIIMLGTNDADPDLNESKSDFVSNYVDLITEFQSLASEPEIWIVKPPPIFDGVNLSQEVFLERVIPGIHEVVNQTGLPLIDLYTPLIGHPDYFIDGIHPKVAGAEIIANVIYEALMSNSK